MCLLRTRFGGDPVDAVVVGVLVIPSLHLLMPTLDDRTSTVEFFGLEYYLNALCRNTITVDCPFMKCELTARGPRWDRAGNLLLRNK